MRKCLSISLLLILLGTYVKADCVSSLIPQDVPESDEYDVYSALLKEMFIEKETKQLVIERYTSIEDLSHSDPGQILERLSPLIKETVEDFKLKNVQAYELNDKFKLQVDISFLTRDEIKELFKTRDEKYDGWKIFHQKYPTAASIITLSRVGFDTERTQALIFVAYGCDWLCGEGNYILLTKKEGRWKIEKKSMTWVS